MTSGEVTVNVDAGNGSPKHEGPLMKKVKEAQKNSSTKCEFFQALWSAISGTVGFAITLAVTLCVPIVMVALGAEYWNYCPAEECLPYWLMAFGSTLIVRQLIAIGCNRLSPEFKEKHPWLKIVHIIDIILFLGFIAGSYWVYHIYQPNFDGTQFNPEYCQPGMYWFTFVVVTATYLLALLFMFAVCFGCATLKLDE